MKNLLAERHGAGRSEICILVSAKEGTQVVQGIHIIPLGKGMDTVFGAAENLYRFPIDERSAPGNTMKYIGKKGGLSKPYQIIPPVRCGSQYCVTLVQ
jgi:hypothetical protein